MSNDIRDKKRDVRVDDGCDGSLVELPLSFEENYNIQVLIFFLHIIFPC
jgi:hypothetical protein